MKIDLAQQCIVAIKMASLTFLWGMIAASTCPVSYTHLTLPTTPYV